MTIIGWAYASQDARGSDVRGVLITKPVAGSEEGGALGEVAVNDTRYFFCGVPRTTGTGGVHRVPLFRLVVT